MCAAEATKKKWIASATKKKGALHRKLGVPEGETIPKSSLKRAAKSKGTLGKEARLAITLSKISRSRTKKRK